MTTGLRYTFACVLLGLACATAGCGSAEKKPSDKELAQKRWAGARANVMIGLAQDQYRSGEFEKARKTIDDSLRMSPESAAAHIMSGRLYIEQGQLEAAERELIAARKYSPNDGEPYYLSGVVMQRWQRHESALEMYKQASERSPAELAYVLAEAETWVALDKQTEALALLQAKADYFEHSSTIRDAIGQIYMQQARYVEAARAFRQAAVLADDEPSIKERLGLALARAKQWRDASDVLSKIVLLPAFAKRADLLCVLGDCQLNLAQARDARFNFEIASQLDPYSPAIWRGLGRAAMESGDPRRAELSLAKSVKFDPNQPETHLLLGYVQMQQQKFADAIKSFQMSASLDPKDTVSLCMIGYAYEKSGKPEAAASFYAKALRLRPEDEMARRLMAGFDSNE